MIIFYEHHVVEPEAMIVAAPGNDRRLFQDAKAGRSLARIQNLSGMFPDRVDKLTSKRGDSTQPLQKIQCDSLGFEDRPNETMNFHDRVTRIRFGAIAANDLHTCCPI